MSAIYGQLNFGQKPLDETCLEKMSQTMNSWRADDVGNYLNNSLGMGHLMLYSSPESLSEKLPYNDLISLLTITADARIYNRDDLIQKLAIPSHQKFIPDSQLILKSYMKWGESCVQYLIGDFAFVIWDEKKQQLYGARDQIGVRPFFYYYSADCFAFATQMRALLILPQISRAWNYNFIHEMLFYAMPFDKEKTFYQDISRLEPAHYFLLRDGKLATHRYWNLSEAKNEELPNDESYIEKAKHLLEESVNCRLRTLYPVGAQLSGGLDSSGISVFSARYCQKNDIHFSVYGNVLPQQLLGKVFPFKDEREYIKNVCEYAGIKDVNYVDYGDKNMSFIVDEQVKLQDGLACNGFSSFTQAHTMVAIQKNVRTLLSGYPGDELVTSEAGYAFYYELFRTGKWTRFWEELMADCSNNIGLALKDTLRIFLYYYGQNILHFYHKLKKTKYNIYAIDQDSLLNPETLSSIIRKLSDNHPYPPTRIFKSVRENEIEDIERSNWIPFRMEAEAITACQYRMNMSYPYSDVRLLEFFYSIPLSLKRRNGLGRYLYRQSMKGILPESIRLRDTSRTFIVPTLFSLMNKDRLRISKKLLTLKDHCLTDLINYDKLISHWDAVKENNFLFQETGMVAFALMHLANDQ